MQLQSNKELSNADQEFAARCDGAVTDRVATRLAVGTNAV